VAFNGEDCYSFEMDHHLICTPKSLDFLVTEQSDPSRTLCTNNLAKVIRFKDEKRN